MAPSYDTVGFLARDAALFREIGRVMLEGRNIEARVERVIVAQDLFANAEASKFEFTNTIAFSVHA
jgi:hypothetical protein